MFNSAYSHKPLEERLSTPCGNEIEIRYGYEVDKKGLKVLVENGTENVYDKIQTYLEETKIENVIQRVIAGDESVLRPDAIYADISEHPKDMLTAMEQIHNLEQSYSELPEEVKKEYPTIQSWVENAGTHEWMKLNGYIQEAPEIVTQEKLQTQTDVIANQVKESTPNE